MGLWMHIGGAVADGAHLGCAVEGVLTGIVSPSDGGSRVIDYHGFLLHYCGVSQVSVEIFLAIWVFEEGMRLDLQGSLV